AAGGGGDGDPLGSVDYSPRAPNGGGHTHHSRSRAITVRPTGRRDGDEAGGCPLREGERLAGDQHHAGSFTGAGIGRYHIVDGAVTHPAGGGRDGDPVVRV